MAKYIWHMEYDGAVLYSSDTPFKFRVKGSFPKYAHYYNSYWNGQNHVTSSIERMSVLYAVSEEFGGTYRIKNITGRGNFPDTEEWRPLYYRIIMCGNPKSTSNSTLDYLSDYAYSSNGDVNILKWYGVPKDLEWDVPIIEGDEIEASEGCRFLLSHYNSSEEENAEVAAFNGYTFSYVQRVTDTRYNETRIYYYLHGYGPIHFRWDTSSCNVLSYTDRPVGTITKTTYNAVKLIDKGGSVVIPSKNNKFYHDNSEPEIIYDTNGKIKYSIYYVEGDFTYTLSTEPDDVKTLSVTEDTEISVLTYRNNDNITIDYTVVDQDNNLGGSTRATCNTSHSGSLLRIETLLNEVGFCIDTIDLICYERIGGVKVEKSRKSLFNSIADGLSFYDNRTFDVSKEEDCECCEEYTVRVSLVECDTFTMSLNKTEPTRGTIEVQEIRHLTSGDVVDYKTPIIETDNAITATLNVGAYYKIKATLLDDVRDEFLGWIDQYETVYASEQEFIYSQTTRTSFYLTAKFAKIPVYSCNLMIGDGLTNALRSVVVDQNGIPTHESNDIAPANGCFAQILTEPHEHDDNGNPCWRRGSNIKIEATAHDGYEYHKMNWLTSQTTNNPSVFQMSSSGDMKVYFMRRLMNVDIEAMHSATDGAKENSYLSISMEGGVSQLGTPTILEQIRYRDTVVFIARCNTTTYANYQNKNWFAGFYKKDGSFLNAGTYSSDGREVTYEMPITEDVTVCALAAISVSVNVHGNGTSTVSYIDASGAEHEATSDGGSNAALHIPLGATCHINTTPSQGLFFGGWFITQQVWDDNGTPLNHGEEFDLTLTEDIIPHYNTSGSLSIIDITSNAVDSNSVFFVAMYNYDMVDNMRNPFIGSLSLVSDNQSVLNQIEEITYEEYINGLTEAFPDALMATSTSESGDVSGEKFYKVTGVFTFDAQAIQQESKGFYGWSLLYMTSPSNQTLYDSLYSTRQTTQLTVNRHWVLKAQWGEPEPVKIIVSAGLGKESYGVQDITTSGDNYNIDVNGNVSCDFIQGTQITINAAPVNGYKFDGWYYNNSCLPEEKISNLQSYTFTAQNGITLFANYIQDAEAIYKWEGSTENKVMRWRSARHVLSIPCSMSSARLYAEEYSTDRNGITLRVDCFQSPDDNNPNGVERRVLNQNTMRLPMMRPNKYIEVEIEGHDTVTNAAVSTSMGGLWQ